MTVNASVSPHIRHRVSTRTVMLDVAIALLPTLLFGVFAFGLPALCIILISALSCILTEFVYQKLMKLPVTVSDGSALVTGLIIALNMPATVPLWVPALGGVFAILFVKQLFGGLGQNIMNPALAGRCFLLISFPKFMGSGLPVVENLFGSDWLAAFGRRMSTLNIAPPDGVSVATPLAHLKAFDDKGLPGFTQLLVGEHSGMIGEICSIAILLGAAYLLLRGVISWRIPCLYVGGTVAFMALFLAVTGHASDCTVGYLLAQVLSGGLLAGAVFMATDYVTSPITAKGQIIYGLLLGFLTALFRVFGSSPEGVSYAIIIGNTVVPLIEKISMPRAFGVSRKKGGAAK